MSVGFERPWLLLLLPGAVLLGWWLVVHTPAALRFSRVDGLPAGDRFLRALSVAPEWLRAGAIGALAVALAGPRTGVSSVEIDAEGIAAVVALDISSSMLAEDFAPDNRFTVARRQVAEFIRGRTYDRIGLVAFSGEALTQVPITIDYSVLFRALERLRVGQLEDGTAIGTAIATAANRLRRAPGESRVIILMTDGENNRGEVDPLTAARAAAAFGVKVYAIGVGSEGVAQMPIGRDLFGRFQYATVEVHIDEELLTDISELTGGRYYRATDAAALDSIYSEIDALETTEVEVRRFVAYTPRYLPFVLIAGLLFLVELALRASPWGRLP
ncbi:MAG: VWA domain-containing protein [Gemmatimonadota bacterium]